MSRRTLILPVFACTLVAMGGAAVFSQPEPVKPRAAEPVKEAPAAAPPIEFDVDEFTRMLEERAAPAEEHKVLETLVGTFKTESRMIIDPESPALTSDGTTTAKWILGKRFVQSESIVGKDPAKKQLASESLTIYGYDTRTNKYTVLALDTLGTYWVSAEGDYDEASRELRLAGTAEEEGQKMKFRWIVKMADASHTTTISINIFGEEWIKVAEVISTKP